MTDHDRDQLLGDILGDEELDQVRQGSLLRGLKEMRRRRRRAIAKRGSVFLLPALLLAVEAAQFFFHSPSRAPASAATSIASVATPKVEYINKEQLFALFPNRPMALVGKPGHQQVIFLDGQAAVSQH
jgi:hypothetical protein